MKSNPNRGLEVAYTKQAILDATEAIMREEGYAAVSSRRVAERAGYKSKLVHNHFRSMDELFLALFRRSEEAFLVSQARALASSHPLREIWNQWLTADTQLVVEFIALARHRQAIRDEIARSNDRVRAVQTAVIEQAVECAGLDPARYPPDVLAFIMAAISRTLVTEECLGASAAHASVRAFVDLHLRLLEKTSAGR
jgi:AcrR family transcriptional regulator